MSGKKRITRIGLWYRLFLLAYRIIVYTAFWDTFVVLQSSPSKCFLQERELYESWSLRTRWRLASRAQMRERRREDTDTWNVNDTFGHVVTLLSLSLFFLFSLTPNFPSKFHSLHNTKQSSRFEFHSNTFVERSLYQGRSLANASEDEQAVTSLSFSPSVSLPLERVPFPENGTVRGIGDRGGTPWTPRFSLQNEKSKRGRLGHASRDAPGKSPAKEKSRFPRESDLAVRLYV